MTQHQEVHSPNVVAKLEGSDPSLKSQYVDDPNINPEKLFADWEQTRYHQPQDEMQQPGLNFDSAATFTKMGFLIGLYTAQDPDPPRWNPGDFFGITFAKGSRQ